MCRRTSRAESPPRSWKPLPRTDARRTWASACERTARGSGRTSSSRPSATTTAPSAAIHGPRRDAPRAGGLATYAEGPRAFASEDLDFLEAVANVVAAAIARARLEEQQKLAERAAAEERIRAARATEAVRER